MSGKEIQLQACFQEQLPDCKVFSDRKIDPRCFRFYFERNKGGWEYIMDLYEQDLNEQDTSKLIEQLERSRWKEVLSANSKKRVPCFKDGRFSEFHDWPESS